MEKRNNIMKSCIAILLLSASMFQIACSPEGDNPDQEELFSEYEIMKLLFEANPQSQGSLKWDLNNKTMDDWEGIVLNEQEKISEISLTTKNLETIPAELGKLKHLNKLVLDANKLTQLPKELGNLATLKVLTLNTNELTDIPDAFENLVNLERLEISFDTKLTVVPKCVGKLSNIKYLGLSGNNISQISEEVKNLKKLEILDFCCNKITNVPEWIGDLENLKNLSLQGNQLETLPASIGNIRGLQYLTIYNNPKLSSIPKEICNLQDNADGVATEIVADPSSDLCKMGKKNERNIEYQALVALYNHNPQSQELLGWDLSDVSMQSWQGVVLGFAGTPSEGKVIGVSLNRKNIAVIPEEFGNLRHLTGLNLLNNKIQTLPNSIGNLDKLERAYFDLNQLVALPETIGDLTQLTRLSLRYNKLSTLPEALGNLHRLRILVILSNPIVSIPQVICDLRDDADGVPTRIVGLREQWCQ